MPKNDLEEETLQSTFDAYRQAKDQLTTFAEEQIAKLEEESHQFHTEFYSRIELLRERTAEVLSPEQIERLLILRCQTLKASRTKNSSANNERVLSALEKDDHLTVRKIAEKTGMKISDVHNSLTRLIRNTQSVKSRKSGSAKNAREYRRVD